MRPFFTKKKKKVRKREPKLYSAYNPARLEPRLHKRRANRFYHPTLRIYPTLGMSPGDTFTERTD